MKKKNLYVYLLKVKHVFGLNERLIFSTHKKAKKYANSLNPNCKGYYQYSIEKVLVDEALNE